MDPIYLQVFFGGLTAGSIYAMIALGFTLVYRATTVINFAHGEFVMLGAMIAISLVAGLHAPLIVRSSPLKKISAAFWSTIERPKVSSIWFSSGARSTGRIAPW